MSDYDKLLQLTSDDTVELATGFKELLHKKLVLGQTRHVCKHGTLSEGHEKITDSQRYYQAIKEMYYLGNNIRMQKAAAMIAQADLLEATTELKEAKTTAQELRAEAKIMIAQNSLTTALVTVEDQMRMLDEYNRIRKELGPAVDAKYPEGIEQAEQDNWTAVAEYRRLKGEQRMDNIPLSPEHKAKLGLDWKRGDMLAAAAVRNKEDICKLANGDANKYFLEKL
jgi:hypothetical protein